MEGRNEERGERRKEARVLTLGLLHLGDKQTDSLWQYWYICVSHVFCPYLKYVSQTLIFIQSWV